MISPISPLVANCYMEQLEKVAISTAPQPPSLWLRYMDDTFTVLHEYDVEEFTEHINSIYPHIKFTIKPEKDSKFPFMDLCTHILDDGSMKITIYMKPTHTDQYLNFKSNHPLTHKRSVVCTLTYREQQYFTKAEDRKSQLAHVHNALRANGYPEWAIAPPPSCAKRPRSTNNNPQRPMLGLPYVAGLLEQLGRIDMSHNIHIYHKPANTLRSMVLHHKEKTPKENRRLTIYNITCDIDTSHTYIENSQPEIQRTYKPA